jgi:hypothetical protein
LYEFVNERSLNTIASPSPSGKIAQNLVPAAGFEIKGQFQPPGPNYDPPRFGSEAHKVVIRPISIGRTFL